MDKDRKAQKKNDPEYARAYDRARTAAMRRLREEDSKVEQRYHALLHEEMAKQGFFLRRSN